MENTELENEVTENEDELTEELEFDEEEDNLLDDIWDRLSNK